MTRSISFSRPMTGFELGLARRLGEVATELVEHQRRGRRALLGAARALQRRILAL